MKEKQFLLILSFCSLTKMNAQDASSYDRDIPLTFLINNDSATYFELDNKHWKILADKNENSTMEDIAQNKLNNGFQTFNQKNGLDYSIQVFWFYYRVKNSSQKEITICLLNNNDAGRSDFYYSKANSEWNHGVTGRLVPLKKMNSLKELNAIPITLDPGEEIEVYNRIKNDYYINKPQSLHVQLGIYNRMLEKDYLATEKNHSTKTLRNLFRKGKYLYSRKC